MNTKRPLAALLLAASTLVVLSAMHGLVTTVSASTPCDDVSGEPPSGQPTPLSISGLISDTVAAAGVQGATVKLYRCSGSTASEVGSTTTDSQGGYSFSGLGTPHWYFVQAMVSGPLSGKTPAGGTTNPTAAIGIGNSVSGVNLSFQ